MGFPRHAYRSGLPFPLPGALPNPGIEPASPAMAGRFLFNLLGSPPNGWTQRKQGASLPQLEQPVHVFHHEVRQEGKTKVLEKRSTPRARLPKLLALPHQPGSQRTPRVDQPGPACGPTASRGPHVCVHSFQMNAGVAETNETQINLAFLLLLNV